jgi:sarcosine oxidase
MSDGAADVIVIGLGAMGAATAFQLARRGARVIGLDRFRPPHEHGSSHGESRLTREFPGEGAEYVPFVRRSNAIWRELETHEGELLDPTGCLLIAEQTSGAPRHGAGHFIEATLEVARSFGAPAERLDGRAIRQSFPQFLAGDEAIGYYKADDGVLRPERCIEVQLERAAALGADLRRGEAVLELAAHGSGVEVVTDRGRYVAARAVLAAGAWLPGLAGGELGEALKVYRQVLYWFEPDEPQPWRQDRAPAFCWFHGEGGGNFFYGVPTLAGSAGVKVATEQYRTPTDPDRMAPEASPAEVAAMHTDHVAGRLRGVSGRCLRSSACLYTYNPHPPGRFVIDRHPRIEGVTIVSACSGHGFKHSAAIGEALAEQLLEGSSGLDLSPFARQASPR